jgi:hypothetical protein
MNKNIGIAVIAALAGALIVFLYYAIGIPKTPTRHPTPCNQGVCPVDVTVFIDCSDPNNILATPEETPIKRGNSNPRIEWTITKRDYTFASNGIDFHGDTQFTNGQLLGPTKFQWFDANSDDKYHKYTINLIQPDGHACPPLDPGIINGQ